MTTTATQTQTSNISARQRKAIRAAALCSGTSYPIVVLEGSDMPPVLRGESYYRTWTPNPNGTRVRCNNPKWRTYYHASTLRIEVGSEFIDRLA